MKQFVAILVCAVMMGRVVSGQDAEKPKGWQKSVALGLTLTSGNSESTLGNASARAELDGERHAVRFGVEGTYGETETEADDGSTEDEVTAQNAKGIANYKLKSGRVYAYGDLTALHDKVADVDYRTIVGPGVGVYAIKEDTMKLELDVGVAWVSEEVADVEDDYMAYRAGERYEWAISETAKLWQSAEFLPTADDFEDYLLSAEIGVEAAVNARVSLRLVVQDKYDSTPGAGLEHNDLITTTALSISL